MPRSLTITFLNVKILGSFYIYIFRGLLSSHLCRLYLNRRTKLVYIFPTWTVVVGHQKQVQLSILWHLMMPSVYTLPYYSLNKNYRSFIVWLNTKIYFLSIWHSDRDFLSLRVKLLENISKLFAYNLRTFVEYVWKFQTKLHILTVIFFDSLYSLNLCISDVLF